MCVPPAVASAVPTNAPVYGCAATIDVGRDVWPNGRKVKLAPAGTAKASPHRRTAPTPGQMAAAKRKVFRSAARKRLEKCMCSSAPPWSGASVEARGKPLLAVANERCRCLGARRRLLCSESVRRVWDPDTDTARPPGTHTGTGLHCLIMTSNRGPGTARCATKVIKASGAATPVTSYGRGEVQIFRFGFADPAQSYEA